MAEFTEEQLSEIVAAATDSTMNTLIKSGMVRSPKQRRDRVNWERILVREYVSKFYPNLPYWIRVEIGAPAPGREDPIYTKTRRWADCIIRMPDHMLIIEAKMKAKPDVVAQLQNYKRLFPSTPLFTKYKDLPIKMQLVCAMCDDETKEFVEDAGIELVIYKPANFEQWFKIVVEKGSGSA